MLLYSFGYWFQLESTLSYADMIYLTIIVRLRFAYALSAELAIIISYRQQARVE